MRIEEFQIKNYKCFNAGNRVVLRRGLVVITGINSAGKTATLEALSLRFNKTLCRGPNGTRHPEPWSTTECLCELSRRDLVEIACDAGGLHLPAPSPGSPFAIRELGITDSRNMSGWRSPVELKPLVDWFLARDRFVVKFSRQVRDRPIEYSDIVDLEVAPPVTRPDGQKQHLTVAVRRDGTYSLGGLGWGNVAVIDKLASALQARIYRFSPERTCIGFSKHGGNQTLETDARNLPEVLSTLQPLADFRKFNELVSRVLPQVKWVSVHPRDTGNEILIWPVPFGEGNQDAAVPLQDCGTGVGHVLAILYVVYTSKESRTILIDEPQSFLHPGAARRLMDALSEFPNHQLIVASHSTTVISANSVSQIMEVENENSTGAIIREVTWEDASHKAALLNELGARLADVYGADNIIWVEGPTEEECFPKILRHFAPGLLGGTAILAVRSTGDAGSRDAERIFDIYRKLSTSGSLIPPTLAFIFDREVWNDQQLKELKIRSNGLLRTTDRRTFENYLLDPAAIAAVINSEDSDRQCPLAEDEVSKALESLVSDKENYKPAVRALGPPSEFTNAPGVLRSLFSQLTEARVSFDKTTHSVAIVDWLLQNNARFLTPLADVLKGHLDEIRKAGSA